MIRLLSTLTPSIISLSPTRFNLPLIFAKSLLGKVTTVVPKSILALGVFISPSNLALRFSKTKSTLSNPISSSVNLFILRSPLSLLTSVL